MVANLWSANSDADIYIVSIYDIIPINDRIDNRLILEATYSSLKFKYLKLYKKSRWLGTQYEHEYNAIFKRSRRSSTYPLSSKPYVPTKWERLHDSYLAIPHGLR